MAYDRFPYSHAANRPSEPPIDVVGIDGGSAKDEAISNMVGSLRMQGSSDAVFSKMYASNPRFRAFADSVRGKSPEQAFRENGLDFSRFSRFKW